MSLSDDFPKLFPMLPNETGADYLWRLLGDKKYLKAVADQVCQDAWDKGQPVWRADEKGIFNLHKDGTREYVKYY